MMGYRRSHPPSGAAAARGFSMIEVLISLVVLAFGLLGFALLQTLNLKYTQSANYRTQATNLAYDLLDQMRANRLSAAQYDNATFAAGTVLGDACTRPVDTVPVTGADSAVERWQCQVVQALGDQASANVAYVAGTATVVITWSESDRLPGPDTTFTVSTRL